MGPFADEDDRMDPAFPGLLRSEVWAAEHERAAREYQRNLDAFLVTDLFNLIRRNYQYGALAADLRERIKNGTI